MNDQITYYFCVKCGEMLTAIGEIEDRKVGICNNGMCENRMILVVAGLLEPIKKDAKL